MVDILGHLQIEGSTVSKVSGGSDRFFSFINHLYKDESAPIFEHNPFHILAYLAYAYELYTNENTGWSGVLGVKDHDLIVFTPNITTFSKFKEDIEKFSKNIFFDHIRIQNVSHEWVEKYRSLFPSNWEILPRSKEEAVYDVNKLNELKGSDFANLRNTRSKLISGNILKFQSLTESNMPDLEALVDKWQVVQGFKYSKNKCEKEKYTCRIFSQLAQKYPELIFVSIGYLENIPVSYCILHKIENFPLWGVLYSVKGLNKIQDGGMRGVSDATYCYCFEKSQKMGIKYLNDGELGTEIGTREHKLHFKPSTFLKSFDVDIKN